MNQYTEQYKEPLQKINSLVEEAIKSKNYDKLQNYCLSEEYQKLPYAVKNYHFITSSKLKSFEICPYAYKLEYIDLIPKPEGWEDKDHFVIGKALDDKLTLGLPYYEKNYCVVQRRFDLDEEIIKLGQKIESAQKKINKDGSRSAVGLKEEESAKMAIELLIARQNQTQLTETMAKIVEQAEKEFKQNELFNSHPKKKVLFLEWSGMLLKAELDDFDGETIRDIKTVSNILNFEPEDYLIQACFYHWLVEENTNTRANVIYEVVDKYTYFSRSCAWEYSQSTLTSARGRLLNILSNLKDSKDTGLFMQTNDQKVKYNSPYYGFEGYGRPQEPIIY